MSGKKETKIGFAYDAFQIPMRGNEIQGDALKPPVRLEFQIPMRGNEMAVFASADEPWLRFKSP